MSVIPKKFDLLVLIGRFQPLHLGHEHTIREALKNSEKLLVLIGSANLAPFVKNPWTFEQRKHMFQLAFPEYFSMYDVGSKIIIEPLNDYLYNDPMWLTKVQNTVKNTCDKHIKSRTPKIGVVGFAENHISYDLNIFEPLGWETFPVNQRSTFHATAIRNNYFQNVPIYPHRVCSDKIVDYLEEFSYEPFFQTLVAETDFHKKYKVQYGNGPFVTVDNLVTQNNCILLIKRGHLPGKGLLALPGGFVKPHQTLLQAALDELAEEVIISDGKSRVGMPKSVLKSYIVDKGENPVVFDHPDRSPRARIITNVFRYEFPVKKELFKVGKGLGDPEHPDAANEIIDASWYPIGSLKANQFFEDHYFIMCKMLGINPE